MNTEHPIRTMGLEEYLKYLRDGYTAQTRRVLGTMENYLAIGQAAWKEANESHDIPRDMQWVE